MELKFIKPNVYPAMRNRIDNLNLINSLSAGIEESDGVT